MTTDHPDLYHYTALLNLPSILREGITKGEVPVSPRRVMNAPNLTACRDGSKQSWVNGSVVDKRKVRLTVSVPGGDANLEPWPITCARLSIAPRWRRVLDPEGHGKNWRIYWGVVPPAWIAAVEILGPAGYAACSGAELREKVAAIEEESKVLIQVNNRIRLQPGRASSWLLDGVTRRPSKLNPFTVTPPVRAV